MKTEHGEETELAERDLAEQQEKVPKVFEQVLQAETKELNMELLEIDSYEEICDHHRSIIHIRTYAFGEKVYKAFFKRTNGQQLMHNHDAYLQVLTDGGWSFLEGYLTTRIWTGAQPSMYGTWEESKDHAERFFEVMKGRITFYHGISFVNRGSSTKSAYKKATEMTCVSKGEWAASVGNGKPYHLYEMRIYSYSGEYFQAVFSKEHRRTTPDMTINKWTGSGWACIETPTGMQMYAKTFNEHGHKMWPKEYFFETVEKRIKQIYCRTEHGLPYGF